jgi:hypothetical protein
MVYGPEPGGATVGLLLRMAGVPGGTGQKYGSESRSRKSGEGVRRVNAIIDPVTVIPEMCSALPDR